MSSLIVFTANKQYVCSPKTGLITESLEMSNLSCKSSKLMQSSRIAAERHTSRQTPVREKTEIVVGDRRQNNLPGERRGRLVRGRLVRGRLVRGRQGWQREIRPK